MKKGKKIKYKISIGVDNTETEKKEVEGYELENNFELKLAIRKITHTEYNEEYLHPQWQVDDIVTGRKFTGFYYKRQYEAIEKCLEFIKEKEEEFKKPIKEIVEDRYKKVG